MLRFVRPESALSALRPVAVLGFLTLAALVIGQTIAFAQSVGLPAPRLLTTMPMGGTQGSEFDLTITGENLEESNELVFSDSRLIAKRKLDANGKPIPLQYSISISGDCPAGLYEAVVMTRLGLSSPRIFSVGTLPEVQQKQPNTAIATAQALPMNSVCNSVMTSRSADYYTFEARKGQRIGVDCAARGIDSKLEAVLVVADATGRDLQVERRSGVIDFSVPADGKYLIKVHELTFQGGPAYFYRLTLKELAPEGPLVRHPSTRGVSAFSWPPHGLAERAGGSEQEPNNQGSHANQIQLPCDVSGSFYPADDLDVYEFTAKKGEEWWIEIASERLGLPTDPSGLIELVTKTGDEEKTTEVLELSDVASPVRVSSNGYAYDGPPYNAGSSDFLGKFVAPQDGTYRLSLTDLFGGTRNDPRNVYRLVIRKAAPDFAVVAWPLHMELRNGDRAALSKPLSIRKGATQVLEVVAQRRDGFDGEIELTLDNLPEGITAQGLKIGAGKTRGLLLVTATADAPRGWSFANFTAKATILGQEVVRRGHLATVAFPIPDSWGEIPSPRLSTVFPISTGGIDSAPLTIASEKGRVIEAKVGEKVTLGFTQTRRSEFSGATVALRAQGVGFEASPALEVPLAGDRSQVVIDLAALKLPPGDHSIAFVGFAVAKFKNPLEPADTAQPRDIVDIISTEPISVRVLPTESK